MPCSDAGTACAPANVLIIAAEDAVAEVIKPRCIAASGNVQKIKVSETIKFGEDERPIRFPDDFNLLEQEIRGQDIRLVIIDPLLGFLSQSIDSHKDQSIRDVLHRLKMVAGATGAAVLGLRHLSKSGSGNALYRGMGSIGIVAAARAAFTVDKHPCEEDTFVFAPTKTNLAKVPKAIKYRITESLGLPVITWGVECDITASDLGTPIRGNGDKGKIGEAVEFLENILTDGERPQTEIIQLADDDEISEKTLRRAQKLLGVEPARKAGKWMWCLPVKTTKMAT
jgi:hypothetical protein